MLKPFSNHPVLYSLYGLCLLAFIPGSAAYAAPTVIIKALNKSSCYSAGEKIEISGKGFGKPGKTKTLVLQQGSRHYPVDTITRWTANMISAQLPKKLSHEKGGAFIVGILERSRWISNRDQTLTLCRSTDKSPFKRKDPVLTTTLPATKPDPRQPIAQGNEPADTSPDISEPQSPFVQANTPARRGSFSNPGAPAFKPNVIAPSTTQNTATADPKEVIVTTSSLQQAEALAQFVQQYQIRIKRRNHYRNLQIVVTVLNIPQEYSSEDVVKQLRESFPDFSIDLNHRYRLLNGNNTATSDSKHWAYDRLGWNDQLRDCQGIKRLGIIDTAIAPTDLIAQQNITQKSLLTPGVKPAKMDHATAIASLLLGAPQRDIPGLLPRAQIYAAAIFRQRENNPMDTNAELIIKALDWLIENQVKVINMSLGGPHNLTIELAIQRAQQLGLIIIAAAGIDAQGSALYPAAQTGVIAVTAIDASNNLLSEQIQGAYIDFSAPGVDLWLLNEQGKARYLSGSSFAAPIVAAAYALLNKDIKTNDPLKQTALDLGEPGRDSIFGWGLLQVHTRCKQ
jgi:hypothetical protein